MSSDTSRTTSTDGRLKSADELWAEEWLAERMKPSRQRNLTPSQRQELAESLRFMRRALRNSETTWAVSPSTDTPGSPKA